jgi:hypothetical protein
MHIADKARNLDAMYDSWRLYAHAAMIAAIAKMIPITTLTLKAFIMLAQKSYGVHKIIMNSAQAFFQLIISETQFAK